MAAEIQLHSFDILEESGLYFEASRVFYAYFKNIPCYLDIDGVNEKLFLKWVAGNTNVVKKYHHSVYNKKGKGKVILARALFVLENKMVIDFDMGNVVIYFNSEEEIIAGQMIETLKTFKIRNKKTTHISLITQNHSGFNTTRIRLKRPQLSLEKHYNCDLMPVHKTMLSSLKQRNKSGVILLHGIPGTGKSTYIRYLIHHLNKKVIFMPPNLAGNLDTPSLASLLIENANAVFVIEDAEDLLLSREKNKNSSISMLLNITDGLLGDSLGIQIIATFNTNVSNIDKALLRKGRLIAMYEFKELAIGKTNRLLQEVNPSLPQADKALTLAEIFNREEESYQYNHSSMQPIGFISRAV